MGASLGIIAGGGDLPGRLVTACRAAGRDPFVLAIEGQAETNIIGGTRHAWVRLGAGGTALDLLRQAGVRDLVFAGQVRRPSFAALRPDRVTAGFIAEIGMRALGDDSLLRLIAQRLEREGFRVVSPQSVLADALAPEGPFGNVRPDAQAESDIARGIAVARAVGFADVGQGVVVQQGLVLAVEAIEGTDAMIARAGQLRREGPGGVLVKTSKPQQDRRLDLPAIGPETVRRCVAAGLRGIAAEAGGVLVVDRSTLIAEADAAGLFVVGVRA